MTSTARRIAWLLVGVIVCAGCAPALRTPPPVPDAGLPVAEAEAFIRQATALLDRRELESVRRSVDLFRSAIPSAPDPYPGFEGLVRALVWLAGNETDPERRKNAAKEAVHGGQWCRQRAPDSPDCAYWLGVALGIQARERRATALDALGPMEELLLEAREGNPDIDHAGPDRVLAILYTRAPGWPRGPGDPEEAVARARAALERHPGHPPNRMALAEALERAGDAEASRDEYLEALKMARAQARPGNPQAAEWVEEIERALSNP